jgi:uncharacterized protein (DUF433 family)
LGFPQHKVRRYINQYWDERFGKKLFEQNISWLSGKTKAVNFYVLIELYTCFRLQELGVKTHQILKARESISKELNVIYPFASAQILTDGKKILYELEEQIINADGTKQLNFTEIIREFVQKITFDKKSNIAIEFFPNGKSSSVIVSPHHQFGLPVLSGTNINTEMIYSMHRSGESIDTISILYDISKKEINDAIKFYEKAA